MRNGSIMEGVKRGLTFYARRLSTFASSGWRLLAAAALLHVALALGLFWAGRAQVAPGFIDRDGIMSSFAIDSYDYQRGAIKLAEILKQDGVKAWATESAPLHVKLISIEFALLGPLFGYNILSAEPLNLLCYLAIVALAFALGREVCSPKVGLFSAVIVALWPTFLLHTLQFLKDPFFIAGTLTLVLCVTTWLTRTYDRRVALRAGAVMVVITLVLMFIRINMGIAILGLVLLGSALLVVRQLRERRLLYWNMACPLLILLAAGALMPFYAAHRSQKIKHYPSDQSGQPKAVASTGLQVPTVITYRPQSRSSISASLPFADSAARRASSIRSRFAASYPDVGSGIDRNVEFRDFTELVLYLPRAFEIGFWTPFPNTWTTAGRSVGSAGKLLSGAETFVIYVCQLLALLAVLRGPRRLASWLLLSISALGLTALGLVVPNVGALYRFRYTFWILLIILGAKGFESVITSSGRWLSRRQSTEVRATAAFVLLACLLATACSRSPRSDSTSNGAGDAARAHEASPTTGAVPEGSAEGGMSLAIQNFTGTSFRVLYLSPSDSAGWEENVLGGDELSDGEIVDIRFNPKESAVLWDLRVEAADGHYAEWKRLDLHEISRIRMIISLAEEMIVVAEVE